MTELQIRPYSESDQEAMVRLWWECGLIVTRNDPQRDIERKLRTQREMFLVGLLGHELVATVMAGYEGHRGWINYLAVATHYQKGGFGRCMMEKAEALLREVGCPKVNLQARNSNAEVIEFYRAIGYLEDDVVSMGKRLEND